jgi:hypothetical protein
MEAPSLLERERRMDAEEYPPVMSGGTWIWF